VCVRFFEEDDDEFGALSLFLGLARYLPRGFSKAFLGSGERLPIVGVRGRVGRVGNKGQ
jgi:hypothetical protein